jgi:hypothetical protein
VCPKGMWTKRMRVTSIKDCSEWHVICMRPAWVAHGVDATSTFERSVTCGSSHHLRWYEPPQMITLSARDGKEMSTTMNRCSYLVEHNICQEMTVKTLLDLLPANGSATLALVTCVHLPVPRLR